MESCRVRIIAVTQGLDIDQRNPTSRFVIQVLGAAVEFERSQILERSRPEGSAIGGMRLAGLAERFTAGQGTIVRSQAKEGGQR